MNLKTFFIILLVIISFPANAQELKNLKNKALNLKDNLAKSSNASKITEDEAAQALKEALDNGIKNSVDIVSKVDGYLNNSEIKIPFPPDAKKIEDKLRNFEGLTTKMKIFPQS